MSNDDNGQIEYTKVRQDTQIQDKMTRASSKRERYRKRRRKKIIKLILLAVIALAVVVGLIIGISKLIGNVCSKDDAVPVLVKESLNESKNPVEEPEIDEEFIEINEYSRPGDKLTNVNNIVVHYTGNPGTTAMHNRDYFESLATSHEAYASSHFVVGLEGEIIQCIPLDEIAYCSNDRNNDTIAIEVTHRDDSGKFNEASYDSLVKLCAWLCYEYNLDSEDIIRHYDVTGKVCPKYFVDYPEEWQNFKDKVKAEIQ